MELSTLLGNYSWLIIPFGLFLGLLGYRLFRISLFITGLGLGIFLGLWIGDLTGNPTLGIILGLVMGLALGVAANFFVRFSLFILGMAAGFTSATSILSYTAVVSGSLEYYLWALGAALAAGLLARFLYKFLVLIMTSLLGTYLIYQGTAAYFPERTSNWLWIPYMVLLAIFIIVQMSGRKGHADPVEKARLRRGL